MMNFFYKLRFLWKSYLTNYFYQDHALQPATREVLVNETFENNQYHYDWAIPLWNVWGNTIFKDSQCQLINNELVMTTEHNDVPNEPVAKSGEVTAWKFLNRTYGFYETCMKPCGSWDCSWLFQSADIPKGLEHFEIDFGEFECDTPNAFTCTIWTYGIDGQGKDGKMAEIIATSRFQGRKPFTEHYHTFGCDWQPDHVSIYLDGILIWKITKKIPSTAMFFWANNQNKAMKLPVSNHVRAMRVQV
jgi:beta-glucanase (GH16 family)